jgi:hypothetical protein
MLCWEFGNTQSRAIFFCQLVCLVKTVSKNTRYLGNRESVFRAIRPREARRDTAATGARLTGTLRSVGIAALTPKRLASKDSARLASADGYKRQAARRLTVYSTVNKQLGIGVASRPSHSSTSHNQFSIVISFLTSVLTARQNCLGMLSLNSPVIRVIQDLNSRA